MGGLSVDIDSDDSIFTGDQSVEKGDFSVTFGLDSELRLWPIFAWRRSKSPQSVIHPFPPKFGKGTLMIASASLEKTMSQPSMAH